MDHDGHGCPGEQAPGLTRGRVVLPEPDSTYEVSMDFSFPTISGVWVDTQNIRAEDIRAWDIGWALSQTNRFNGHTPVAWDVLSHVGLTYRLYVEHVREKQTDAMALAILLHDSPEAYLGDMIGPLKWSPIGDAYRPVEDATLRTIYRRFGLDPDAVDWEAVDRYDKQALHVEVHELRPRYLKDPKWQRVWHPVYPLDRYPQLIKARPAEFVAYIRDLAIRVGTPNIPELCAEPEDLADVLNSAARVEERSHEHDVSIDWDPKPDPVERLTV